MPAAAPSRRGRTVVLRLSALTRVACAETFTAAMMPAPASRTETAMDRSPSVSS